MWPTTNGLRCLAGDEFELVRAAVGMMVDQLVAEGREGDPQEEYGIHWFDQWDWQQRIWLLERVSLALLTDLAPPSPGAIWEATVDAVFHEVRELVELEVRNPDLMQPEKSWRQCVFDAFVSQQNREPEISVEANNLKDWHLVITQIADSILGVRLYLKAESFRDVDIDRTKRFLTQHGLPSDFLELIPPLRTIDQTQISIDHLQTIVFR